MSNSKSKFVVMKLSQGNVGNWSHHKDWTRSEAEGERYCEKADGMSLALWTRQQYESWHSSNVMPYYR